MFSGHLDAHPRAPFQYCNFFALAFNKVVHACVGGAPADAGISAAPPGNILGWSVSIMAAQRRLNALSTHLFCPGNGGSPSGVLRQRCTGGEDDVLALHGGTVSKQTRPHAECTNQRMQSGGANVFSRYHERSYPG